MHWLSITMVPNGSFMFYLVLILINTTGGNYFDAIWTRYRNIHIYMYKPHNRVAINHMDMYVVYVMCNMQIELGNELFWPFNCHYCPLCRVLVSLGLFWSWLPARFAGEIIIHRLYNDNHTMTTTTTTTLTLTLTEAAQPKLAHKLITVH